MKRCGVRLSAWSQLMAHGRDEERKRKRLEGIIKRDTTNPENKAQYIAAFIESVAVEKASSHKQPTPSLPIPRGQHTPLALNLMERHNQVTAANIGTSLTPSLLPSALVEQLNEKSLKLKSLMEVAATVDTDDKARRLVNQMRTVRREECNQDQFTALAALVLWHLLQHNPQSSAALSYVQTLLKSREGKYHSSALLSVLYDGSASASPITWELAVSLYEESAQTSTLPSLLRFLEKRNVNWKIASSLCEKTTNSAVASSLVRALGFGGAPLATIESVVDGIVSQEALDAAADLTNLMESSLNDRIVADAAKTLKQEAAPAQHVQLWDAYMRVGHWMSSLQVLQHHMPHYGVRPKASTYAACAASLVRQDQWKLALLVAAAPRRANIAISRELHAETIRALAAGRSWSELDELDVEHMPELTSPIAVKLVDGVDPVAEALAEAHAIKMRPPPTPIEVAEVSVDNLEDMLF